MGRYAKEESGSSFQQAPAGTHVARCIRIIDIGNDDKLRLRRWVAEPGSVYV